MDIIFLMSPNFFYSSDLSSTKSNLNPDAKEFIPKHLMAHFVNNQVCLHIFRSEATLITYVRMSGLRENAIFSAPN